MKRILAMAISVMLVASLAIGGTIAYLTDTDERTNVFEMGDVDIEQIEEERKDTDGDGEADGELETFVDDKRLLPSYDFKESNTNGDPKDNYEYWDAALLGDLDKIVTVENKGDEAAYIRTIFAFEDTSNVERFIYKNYNSDTSVGTWEAIDGTAFIADVPYKLYVYTYVNPLAAAENGNRSISEPSLKQVAMDASVDNAIVDAIASIDDGKYTILVATQAVQASNMGSLSAGEALDEAFYDITVTEHPWTDVVGTITGNVTRISSAADLLALSGTQQEGTIYLDKDIDMGGAVLEEIGVTYNKALTFVGNGHTISNVKLGTGNHGGMTNVGMFYAETGSSLTVSNLTIEDASVTGVNEYTTGAAVVVGYANGNSVVTLDNVDVKDASVTNANSNAALLVGYTVGTVNLTDCEVSGAAVGEKAEKTGAFVGTANTDGCTVNVNDCTNNSSLTDYGRVINQAKWIEGGVMQLTAKDQASFEEVLKLDTSNGAEIELVDGNYTLPGVSGNANLLITGSEDVVIDVTKGAYMEKATVAFEGVTFKVGTGYVNGNGSDYAALYSKNVSYINCTFVGPFRIGRDGASFINCRFTGLGNDYVWNYGNSATFQGCIFETDGKALLLYSDGNGEVPEVSVTSCTFRATAGAKAGAIANQNCAAIEIDNYGCGVDLTASGNTIDGDFSGEWRIKSYDVNKTENTVTVNNVKYNGIAIDGKAMTIDANKNVTVL